MLATLRGILDLRQKEAPDLYSISFQRSSATPELPGTLKDFTGLVIHVGARAERTVCRGIG